MSARIKGAEYPQSSPISYCLPSICPAASITGFRLEKFGISEVSQGCIAPMLT